MNPEHNRTVVRRDMRPTNRAFYTLNPHFRTIRDRIVCFLVVWQTSFSYEFHESAYNSQLRKNSLSTSNCQLNGYLKFSRCRWNQFL